MHSGSHSALKVQQNFKPFFTLELKYDPNFLFSKAALAPVASIGYLW